jgi:hypothetical protein
MSSVWILERVFLLSKPVPLAMCPCPDKSVAEKEAAKLSKFYGADIQPVEYRRVEPERSGK